jgi:hypothetical protein
VGTTEQMRRRSAVILAATVILALLAAACHSASPSGHGTSPTPTASLSRGATPSAASPSPCASSNPCYRHGTISVTMTGATATAFSAPLDDVGSYVNLPAKIDLVYTQPNGFQAAVGATGTVGTDPSGAVRVSLLPSGAGYVGVCTVSVTEASSAGAAGTAVCPKMGTLFGGISTGTVDVTATFSASP